MSFHLASVKTQIFADGADVAAIAELAAKPFIQGFTTNPTLMRKAGVTDYEKFARDVLSIIGTRPISFEVLSDDPAIMEAQALTLASWGDNVYVKVPITNTAGEWSTSLIERLVDQGVKVNVTAMTTLRHAEIIVPKLAGGPAACISMFAGRVADTGRDPVPLMQSTLKLIAGSPNIQLIWASPREVLNVVQADAIGCHIITVTPDILKKLPLLGRELEAVSLDTVKMFTDDAKSAGFNLPTAPLTEIDRFAQSEIA